MTHPGSQHGWHNRSWPQQPQMGQQPFPQQQPVPPPPPGAYPPHGNFPPPQQPKKKRTGLIVALSLVAALLVVGGGVAGVVAMLGKAGSTAEPFPQPGPPAELPIHPGNGVPAQYGGMTPPNACSLLPFDLVAERGWKIAPKQSVTEEVLDPYSTVQNPVTQSGKAAAFCKVFFEKEAMLMITFEGPPFNEPSILDSQIRNVLDSEEKLRSGEWTYRSQWEDGFGVVVDMTDGVNLVTLSVVPPEETPQDRALGLAKEVVPGLIEKIEAAPKAPNVADYPAPYGKLVDPCQILTADDLASLGTAPNGLVFRRWAAAERVLYKLDRPDPTRYVETSCARTSLNPANSAAAPNKSLSVSIETMRNESDAKKELDFYIDPNAEISRKFGPAQRLSSDIGDEHAYFVQTWNGKPAILFRVGRHLVGLNATEDFQMLPPESMEKRYKVIANKIVERLRSS